MIKMIVTDIDGTLINDEGIISPRTKKALIAAQETGIRLVIATGRSPQYCNRECEQLEMHRFPQDYIIALNGQEIHELSTGQVQCGPRIPAGKLPGILRLAFDYDLEALCYDGARRFHYSPPDFQRKKEQYLREHPDLSPVDYESIQGENIPLPSFDTPVPADISKVAFLHSAPRLREVLPAVRRRADQSLQVSLVKPTWLEIFPQGISKGNALRQLMARTEITPDEVLAFGDGENDIDMLTSVTYGFAMGNAFPAVKKAAYGVTKSNNQDGIEKIISEFRSSAPSGMPPASFRTSSGTAQRNTWPR